MQQNVGTLDKLGRAALSMALLAYAWKSPGRPAILAACGAGMLLSSVASGHCPAYKVLNLNTVGKPL